MRNLKKILALAVVFAMAFTFTAGAAFTDAADIGADYVDDINMLVELGVIGGYPDGSVKPQANITRAEFAKMAYTLKYGSDTDGNLFASQKSSFVDVEGVASVAWAKGYINFCANQKIVSGKGANKFDPQSNITVAEATKMILVIMGVNPDKEGLVGANWISNTVALGMQLGVYDGWAGDPTQLATRELVAKLMRNAIFSPVFEYSAITGTGSQYNFEGKENITLGEKTMDLKTVTGIVIANERYALATNEDGEDFADIENFNADVEATGIDSEESVILYEAKRNNGDIIVNSLVIDRALSDDMLGKKVNVFFKADMASSAEYSYKNVEVIGDVLVHSDTVSYEVSSANVKLMPNGEGSSSMITPYIGFTVDGVEKTIKAPDVAKMAKNTDALDNVDVLNAFVPYSYISTETLRGNDAAELIHPTASNTADFFAAMGEGSLAKYRFVSVDGGKSYSYIFKMLDAANAKYAAVSNYSESKGTIYLTGIGSVDLEDCVINGSIAKDDYVVYYRENGKYYVNKVETITGAVESFGDDGSVVVNGKAYYPDVNLCEEYTRYADDLFNFYQDNRGALNANTKYYVYGDIILQIEASDDVSSVESYAVITNSYYDAGLKTAYVELTFSDNTKGTYKVGKLYTKNSSTPYAPVNDLAKDFVDNNRFGWVVKYNLRDDGSVDLSGQYFKKLDASDEAGDNLVRDAQAVENYGAISVRDGKLIVDGDSYYGYSDNTVVFVITGDLTGDDSEVPVSARAYKLADIRDFIAEAISGTAADALTNGFEGNVDSADIMGSFVINENGYEKSVVAAAVTFGDGVGGTLNYSETNNLGYVVSAVQRYNVATDNYYAEIKLISEDGLINTKTVDAVTDLSTQEVLDRDVLGKIDGPTGKFPKGSFVRYTLNADNVITTIDVRGGDIYNDVLNAVDYDLVTGAARDGLYAINVASVKGNRLSFYETDADIALDGDGKVTNALSSLLFHEDGYDVITIDDDAYAGSDIIKLPSRIDAEDLDAYEANEYNAVIEVEEGQIVRIFSFTDMQSNI